MPRRKPTNKNPKRKKKADSYAEDEESSEPEPSSSEEEESDHKDDEDYKSEDGDSSDDDDSFDEDDEDYDKPARKKRRVTLTKRTREAAQRKRPTTNNKSKTRISSRQQKPAVYETETSDDNDDDESSVENPPSARRQSRRTSPRQRKKIANLYKEADSDSDNESDSESPRRRPSRLSAAKATAKMNRIRYNEEHADDSELSEEDNDPLQESSKKSRKKNPDSDEEEFQLDDSGKQQDDEDAGSFLNEVDSIPSDSQGIGNVGDDFFDDERSDDGEGDKQRNIASNRPRAQAKSPESYHSESEDEKEIEPTPTKPSLSQEERIRNRARSGRKSTHLQCTSEVDEITNDPLPKLHVCYVSPDGHSSHCFALETLHKIAMSSQHPKYRTNLSNEQQLTFLQPPHFRSAMSDDLLDQIASRFGRASLDLNGEFYKRDKHSAAQRKSGSGDDEFDNGGYQVNFTAAHNDDVGFIDSWHEYQVRTMKSQDVYPCPLCYAVAHHRLAAPPSDESSDEDTQSTEKAKIALPDEFSFDPMTVLGSLDNDEFEISGAFCFKRIAQVKQHLREDHGCDTKRISSEVFHRYKVRTQDGLLQRFLSKKTLYGNTKQGDMRRYWYDGNSELFIYLLYLMDQNERFRNSQASQDDNDDSSSTSNNPLAKAQTFFNSFQSEAEDLWERIVAPFSRGKGQDLKDFFDDEEAVGESDEVPHHVFDMEQAMSSRKEDEELANYYKERIEGAGGDDSSCYEDEEAGNEFENIGEPDSESEVDEWEQEIRKKQKRRSLERKNSGTSGSKLNEDDRRASVAKRRASIDSNSSFEEENIKPLATSGKNRVILDDSD